MRIAFILPMFPVLSETFILNQITGLVDRGHDVRIFAFSKDYNRKRHADVIKYNLESRFLVVEAPRSRLKLALKALFVLVRYPFRFSRSVREAFMPTGICSHETLRLICCSEPFLKSDPFDILHCHFGPSGIFAVRLKKLLGLDSKVAVSFHGFDMTRYIEENGNDVYKNLFAEGDLFLPVTEKWKKKLLEMGCPKSRIRVHRMGINLEKFPRRCKRISPNQGITKILTVGRFFEKKGIEYGIKAIAQLIRKRPKTQLLYHIAGDGPLRSEMETLIQSLACERYVKMLGWCTQDEITALMEDAHIFLAPSVKSSDGDQEGLPVVLMEALAKGLVVCSTFHSGIPELIDHGKSGFLAPERDENALCAFIENIIDANIDTESICREGYRKIEEEFDVDKLNDRLLDLFEDS